MVVSYTALYFCGASQRHKNTHKNGKENQEGAAHQRTRLPDTSLDEGSEKVCMMPIK
jgi:hypothetical protein